MKKLLGRELESKEYVHHKDGDWTNNDPSNLELMAAGDHTRHHLSGPEHHLPKWKRARVKPYNAIYCHTPEYRKRNREKMRRLRAQQT